MKILAFGITKEYIGQSEIELNDDSLSTVAHLKNRLIELYPNLKSLNSLAIAVNEVYAAEEDKIEQNDVVALIPPVSGG